MQRDVFSLNLLRYPPAFVGNFCGKREGPKNARFSFRLWANLYTKLVFVCYQVMCVYGSLFLCAPETCGRQIEELMRCVINK